MGGKEGGRARGSRELSSGGLCFLGADSRPWAPRSFRLSVQPLRGRAVRLASHPALPRRSVRPRPLGEGDPRAER